MGTLDLLVEGKGAYPWEEAALYQPAQAPGVPESIIPPPSTPRRGRGQSPTQALGQAGTCQAGFDLAGRDRTQPQSGSEGLGQAAGRRGCPGVAVEAGPD